MKKPAEKLRDYLSGKVLLYRIDTHEQKGIHNRLERILSQQ